MKKQTPHLLFALAVISLLTISAVVANGIINGRKKNNINTGGFSNVLGEHEENVPTPTSIINGFIENTVKNTLQNTLQSTKETVSEKVVEVEKEIIKTVEKEATRLTESQVNTLKYQVCKDWGVITGIPTSPTPIPTEH